MQMPGWQIWGEAANRALDEVARAVPDFDKLAQSLGLK
jgi:chemotaxis regulatin CheY-phosphate phosphatase CheZ